LCRVQFIVRGKLDLSFTHRTAYCLCALDRWRAKVEILNKMLWDYQEVCAKQDGWIF